MLVAYYISARSGLY